MTGRDPHEAGRVATSLELLFDLTFVVAFGVAGEEAAHLLAEGHVGAAAAGFCFAMFAIIWAWINFTWFASAFDTDDWVYRVTTLLQMVGVIILALGLPPMFTSIDEEVALDITVIVLGYVVMRVAMVAQWLRAAGQAPEYRRVCLAYAVAILVSQVGWLALIAVRPAGVASVVVVLALLLVELLTPWVAERQGDGTPWHAHHISERYSLLAIIGLGEVVVGTVAAVSGVVAAEGWSVDAALAALAGTGLAFAMWWMYFMIPSAAVLHRRRDRAFSWAYGHLPLFAAIAGTGAGLHVAGFYLQHEAHVGSVVTVLTAAVPVAVYMVMVYALHDLLVRRYDGIHTLLLLASAVLLVGPVLLAAAGVSMAVCLVVLMFAPIVSVVGYETVGHRHSARALARTVG